jgi:hypothetical protein
MNVLLNMILPAVSPIQLRWNPLGGITRKLKHDAEYGELIKFVNGGRLLLVLPEGYKRPQVFHPGFWEPLYEEFEKIEERWRISHKDKKICNPPKGRAK